MSEKEKNRYLIGCYFIKGNMANGVKNHISVVEVVNGVKQVVNISDPKITFFYDKQNSPGEGTQRMYVPLANVEEYSCPYSEMAELQSELTGIPLPSSRNSYQERREVLDTFRKHPSMHGSDVNMEDHYIGRYMDKYKDEIIEGPTLHKCHSDIELDVYSTEAFPSVEDAICPIDLMTIYSDKTNSMWTYALTVVDPPNPLIAELKADKEAFEKEMIDRFKLNDYNIMFFDDEVVLIKAYFKKLHFLKPDFIGFWNMIAFDFKYIYRRIEVLTGQHPASIMCPPPNPDKKFNFPKVDINIYEDDKSHDFSTMGSYVKVVGWTNWIDQLLTFANLRATAGKMDSYSLDAISESILDEKDGRITKDPLPVSIKEVSRFNYRIYVTYNCQDVHLIHRIEKKTKDIDLIYRIAMTTRTRIHKAWRKTTSLRNMADKFMRDIGYVCSNNHNSGGEVKAHVKFEGAWVASPDMNEPEGVIIGTSEGTGKRQNAIFDNVSDLDLTSLYPMIILALMIDPANQVYRVSFTDLNNAEKGHWFVDELTAGNIIGFCADWFNLPSKDELLTYFSTESEESWTSEESKECFNNTALSAFWFSAALDLIEGATGGTLSKSDIKMLEKWCSIRFTDKRCRQINSYTGISRTAFLSEVAEYILKEKPIIAGNGTLFKREDRGGLNITGSFIADLIAERKRIKGQMFTAKEAGNEADEVRLDMRQKVFKILANAFFGVIGQPSFIFNDTNSAPAITLTGQVIITTLVQNFEAFFGDNWKLSCTGDAFELINLATANINDDNYIASKKVTAKEVFNRIVGKLPEDTNTSLLDLLKSRIDDLSVSELKHVYYINNLFEFLREEEMSDIIAEILGFSMPSGNVEDIKDPKLKELLDQAFAAISDYVIIDKCFEPRMKFCETTKRNTVLVCDTDSTFILVDKFVRYVEETFDWDPSQTDVITACNIAVYFLSKFSPMVLNRISANRNVEDDKRKYFSLKNEFLYKRLMLTENKKSYAGLLLQREGKMVLNPKDQLDIKGLDIKKVKTNAETRKYFQEVLKTLILGMAPSETDSILTDNELDEEGEWGDNEHDEDEVVDTKKSMINHHINLTKVVTAFAKYEEMVHTSLQNGEMKFAKPAKFSGIKAYTFPYRMEAFRGVLVWNDVFPSEPIRTLEYVHMFKTTANTVEKFDAIVEEYDFSEEDLRILKIVRNTCFTGENMPSYGFTRICIPRSVKETPTWVLPFIDEASIVEDNIKSALILLECLGVRCVTVRGSSKFTNIVEF